MQVLQKTLIAFALAAVVALGVVWSGQPVASQRAGQTVAEDIQKPGHVAIALAYIDTTIQKPGH